MDYVWGEKKVNQVIFSESMQFIDFFMKDKFFCLESLADKLAMKKQYIRKIILSDELVKKVHVHPLIKKRVKEILSDTSTWIMAPGLNEVGKEVLMKASKIEKKDLDLLEYKFIVPASNIAQYINKHFYMEEEAGYAPISYEFAYMLVTRGSWYNHSDLEQSRFQCKNYKQVKALLNDGSNCVIKLANCDPIKDKKASVVRYIHLDGF